jgi:hypothetical protein
MLLGLRRKGMEEIVDLRWGQIYHAALELHDKLTFAGAERHEATRSVVRYVLTETWDEYKPWAPEHNKKTRPNLLRSVLWYLEFFSHDNASTVRLANGKPAVELSFRLPVDNGIVLSGHLDRVVDWPMGGGSFVMDRKTTGSAVTPNYFDQYKPDNQMSLYSFAGAAVLSAPIKGVIIDAVQVAVGFSRYARGITYRSNEELDEWLEDTYAWIDKAHRAVDRGHFLRNDKSCHKYSGCPFRRVCGAAPSVRKQILEGDYEVRQWNPLASR